MALFSLFLAGINTVFSLPFQQIQIFHTPEEEKISYNFKVFVNRHQIDVYPVKVAAVDPVKRFKAVDDILHSSEYFDNAVFCTFGLSGEAVVNIKILGKIKNVKILPALKQRKIILAKHSFSFKIVEPQNLTVEINGDEIHSLHIFVNPLYKHIPDSSNPNLIYFGPGIHYVSNMVIGNNKTVYLASGAIIRAIIGKNEKYTTETSGLRNYVPTFQLYGNHIRFEGAGIIDATGCSTHARSIIEIRGQDIKLEGVILKNPSVWTVAVKQSRNIEINNIKIIGYRANSDGIDICNSNYVKVTNCFVRTNDDLIVLKTFANQGAMNHVVVEKCILWNQLAHGLSLGAELYENVDDVLFSKCDIIHDTGREWSLRVFQAGPGAISNIRFENINIQEANHFISLWIGNIGISEKYSAGTISNVSFKNINGNGPGGGVELLGSDEQHKITSVYFNNVHFNGKLLSIDDMRVNPFVSNLVVGM